MNTLTHHSTLQRTIDADFMRGVLEEFASIHWPDVRLRTVAVLRVIPKKTGEVVIQYELSYYSSNGPCLAPRLLYAQYQPSSMEEYRKSEGKFARYDDLNLIVWAFPSDPELDHLSLLSDVEQFHRTYDTNLENVGYSHVIMGTPAEVLGYRLGRRCVARVRWQDRADGGPARFPKNDIVIKMARRRQSLALWTRWRQLEHEGFSNDSADGIGMPKSLFLHSGTGALFQDYAHEASIHDSIQSTALPFHCGRAAMTLAKLHASHIPGLTPYSLIEELERLRWLTAITGQAFPIVALNLTRKLDDLIAVAPADYPSAYVTTHRDFYDKQVLSGEKKTVLLDCDTLALADPALDYGNFVAHLHWRGLQYPDCAGLILEGIAQFRDEYVDHSIEFHNRALWWTKATLLRLACIYSWRPRWHHLGVELADRDHESLCRT